MKKKIALAMLFVLAATTPLKVHAQNIAINTTGNRPDTSAMLEITSTSQGLLIPRMTTAQRSAIYLPATGLLIFNKDINAFEVNIGNTTIPVWNTLSTVKNAWNLNGNSGSTSSNFIGTTDNVDLVFKRGNIQAALLDSTLYNTSFGYAALNSSNSGSYNSAIGFQSLKANTSGSNNTAIGFAAGKTNTAGSSISLLGSNADVASNNLVNATAIGANAQAAQSNSIVLGSINGVNGATASASIGIGTNSPVASLDNSGTFKMGPKGTVSKNAINFSASLSSTAITSGTAAISTTGIAIGPITAVGTVNNPTFTASATDLTITIPIGNQPTSTQATVIVSPNFDLPAGVSIASARLASTSTVKVRFVNASTSAATLSSSNVYVSIQEF